MTYFSKLPVDLLREVDLYIAYSINRDPFGYVPPAYRPLHFISWYRALRNLKVIADLVLEPVEFRRPSLIEPGKIRRPVKRRLLEEF